MSIRESLTDYSKGDFMEFYWTMFWCRERSGSKAARDILTFVLNRMAHWHGGYIGSGAKFEDEPFLPHGLHGIYISRYASVGANCCIYQNITGVEVDGKAPRIGDHCLIGAGAVLVGDITSENLTVPTQLPRWGPPTRSNSTALCQRTGTR